MAQSLTIQIALMAIIVAGLSVYMIATRNRVRRSLNNKSESTQDRLADMRRRSQVGRDLNEVMGELDDLARQINGKLDIRFAKLEAVIRDADQRIDELSRLVRRAQGRPSIDVTVSEEHTVDAHVDEPVTTNSDMAASKAPIDEALHADVYEWADQGLSPVDVAAKTDRTVGEVELILALRRVKEKTDAHETRRPEAANARR